MSLIHLVKATPAIWHLRVTAGSINPTIEERDIKPWLLEQLEQNVPVNHFKTRVESDDVGDVKHTHTFSFDMLDTLRERIEKDGDLTFSELLSCIKSNYGALDPHEYYSLCKRVRLILNPDSPLADEFHWIKHARNQLSPYDAVTDIPNESETVHTNKIIPQIFDVLKHPSCPPEKVAEVYNLLDLDYQASVKNHDARTLSLHLKKQRTIHR